MNTDKLTKSFVDNFRPDVGNIDAFTDFIEPSGPKTLVIGSKVYDGTEKPDRRSLYESAVGIDLEDGSGVDFIHDITTKPVAMGEKVVEYDHLDCVSMLEHCKKPWLAAENMQKNLKSGGSMLICVPFSWRIHAYPDDYFRFSTAAIRELFDQIEWKKLCYMSHGVKVPRTPAINTEYGVFYARTEVLGFGIKR